MSSEVSKEENPQAPPVLDDKIQALKKGLPESEIAPFWLSAIIESAEDAIISKTLEGIITSWNKGAQRLFGYTPEEAIGNPVLILIPPDLQHEEVEILSRIRRGERIEHYETIRRRKDGTLLNISLTVSPIKDDKGNIIGASKIARDITERKRTDERLKEALQIAETAREQAEQARMEAETANNLKDEFLATVSHELRTPLTSMLGWVQMLLYGNPNTIDTKKALETIYRNVKSQAQLVEDLLDISRITRGQMRLEMTPLDPVKVVNAAVESIKPAAQAKGIRLQLILDADAGVVNADFERLQQVIWNLLSNSVKFTQPGGKILIRLERVESFIEIEVSDNGIGISPEFINRMFDRFSQADGSITRKFGGMGMGLAIVKSIAELHGGTVSAKSEGEGTGASFTVKLPVAEASKEALTEKTSAKDNAAENERFECPPELKGLKILVVDDQLETCEMVGAALEQCGSKVTISLSAAEALGELEKQQPDVLIADLSMPETDGFELIQQIRQRSPEEGGEIPAVAFTAMARIDDRVRALAAGYQMYIAKPVNISELRTVVSSLASMLVKK